MGSDLKLLETDRIVQVNDIKLCVHDDFRRDRRNVSCYSKKLEDWLKSNPSAANSPTLIFEIGRVLEEQNIDDYVVVEVKGFY